MLSFMFKEIASILGSFSEASGIFRFSVQFIFLDTVLILFNVCLVIMIFSLLSIWVSVHILLGERSFVV